MKGKWGKKKVDQWSGIVCLDKPVEKTSRESSFASIFFSSGSVRLDDELCFDFGK